MHLFLEFQHTIYKQQKINLQRPVLEVSHSVSSTVPPKKLQSSIEDIKIGPSAKGSENKGNKEKDQV